MLGTLARASLDGALLVAAIWACCRIFPRIPPAARAALWWCAAAKFVVALVWTAPLPVPILPAPAPTAGDTRVARIGTTTGTNGHVADEAAPDPGSHPEAAGSAASAERVMLVIWIAGIAASMGIALRRWRQTAGIVRRATPAPELEPLATDLASKLGLRRVPAVRLSEEVGTPLVTGLLRPVALLPGAFDSLPGDQQRMALCHELAHVKRADLWLGCAPALAERLFFFHPLVRLAAREYAFWREAACDAAVLDVLGAPPQAYGRLLLNLGIAQPDAGLAAAGASWSLASLKRRITMLGHPPVRSTASRTLAAAGVIVAVAAMIPIELTARRAQMQALEPTAGLAPESPVQDRKDRDKNKEDELNFVLFHSENSTTMSGSTSDIRRALEFKRGGEPLLWFRHEGREYIVRDQSILAEVQLAWVPVNKIGDEQGAVGAKQGALGEQQGKIGEQQGALGEEQGKIGERQGRVGERQGELAGREARIRNDADRAVIDRQRRELDNEMRALDAQMQRLDERMRELDAPMRDLDGKMRELDKQMEALDDLMRDATRKAERTMRDIVARALATGAAEQVRR